MNNKEVNIDISNLSRKEQKNIIDILKAIADKTNWIEVKIHEKEN